VSNDLFERWIIGEQGNRVINLVVETEGAAKLNFFAD